MIVVRTFQMRLPGDHPALDAMAEIIGRAQRTTYARARRRNAGYQALKAEICAEFGLPARLFNALAIDLAGLVDSKREKAKFDAGDIDHRLAGKHKALAKVKAKMANTGDDVPEKLRRLGGRKVALERTIARLESRKIRRLRDDAAFPAICFGGRQRFSAQHHLETNRYGSHLEWRANWRRARASQILVVGSDDESAGNKTCKATVEDDGALGLRLLLPEPLRDAFGSAPMFTGLRFPFGHAEIVEAIANANAEYRVSQAWQAETAAKVREIEAAGAACWQGPKDLEEALRALRVSRRRERAQQTKIGHAVTWRFVKDSYGWRVFATISQRLEDVVFRPDAGVIGVDFNADHIAIAIVGPDGALKGVRRFGYATSGKTSGQREARFEEIAAAIAKMAEAMALPVVVEDLDFRRKRKNELADIDCPKKSRGLSALAYRSFSKAITAACRLRGVALKAVEPAYTSLIGKALYAVPLGLSVHHAAALVIGRRGMGRDEQLSDHVRVPRQNGRPAVLPVPARLRRKALDAKRGVQLNAMLKAEPAARPPSRPGGAERRFLRSAAGLLGGGTG